MNVVRLFVCCACSLLFAIAGGCASGDTTSPPADPAELIKTAEAVPIGLKITIEGMAPSRILKIVPILDGDTVVGRKYLYTYDIRYTSPSGTDVQEDPEQYLTLSDEKRIVEITSAGQSLDITVPVISKSTGSADVEVFVTVSYWPSTGDYKKGAADSVVIDY